MSGLLNRFLLACGMGKKPITDRPEFDETSCFKRQCCCEDSGCCLTEQYPRKWDRGNLMISNRCRSTPPSSKRLGVWKQFTLYRAD